MFLGIDVSKKTFDACLINDEQKQIFNDNFSMNNSGFQKLDEKLKSFEQNRLLIVLESTGIYHINLSVFFTEKKFNVAIMNPLLIHNFIKSVSLRKSKTDRIDAFRIAQFALYNNAKIETIESVPKSIKSLNRERENLSKNIAKLKTEIKALLQVLFPELVNNYNVFVKAILNLLLTAPGADKIKKLKPQQIEAIIDSTKGNRLKSITPRQFIKLARKSIAHEDPSREVILIMKIKMLLFIINQKNDLNKMLKDYIKQNQHEEFEIITSIKGIGQNTAEKFLIELDDINLFDSHKKLRAYIGTDPSIKQSGSSINKSSRISKRGNAILRKTIWQMAVSVIRYCDKFHEYFLKKKNEGKKYKQAVIAVANKLIKTLYALLKNKVKFSPNYGAN
jgi:transposase